jgi:hypothetical protein
VFQHCVGALRFADPGIRVKVPSAIRARKQKLRGSKLKTEVERQL